MSIVAMKRKSRGANNPISGYNGGFSLNGGRRSQGWVGHSSLGRSSNIKSCSNDSSIIKRSTMNTKGYITSRVTNPTSVFYENCNSTNSKKWVQVFNEYDHSQSGYVDNVRNSVASNCDVEEKSAGDCNNKCNYVGVFAVGPSATGAISSSEYMKSGLLRTNCLPTPNCKAHWPQWINHNGGCNVNYKTPGGGFPADWNWGNCSSPYY